MRTSHWVSAWPCQETATRGSAFRLIHRLGTVSRSDGTSPALFYLLAIWTYNFLYSLLYNLLYSKYGTRGLVEVVLDWATPNLLCGCRQLLRELMDVADGGIYVVAARIRCWCAWICYLSSRPQYGRQSFSVCMCLSRSSYCHGMWTLSIHIHNACIVSVVFFLLPCSHIYPCTYRRHRQPRLVYDTFITYTDVAWLGDSASWDARIVQ